MSTTVVSSPGPSHEWTAHHAYFLWLRGGQPDGQAAQYWAQAESEYPSYLAWKARVERAAYKIWLEAGRPEGQERRHWREAERRVMAEDII